MNKPEDYDEQVARINGMTHIEMARLWRFAPSGHPYFDGSLPYYELFRDRFLVHFGGFTPELSKAIGWGERNPQS